MSDFYCSVGGGFFALSSFFCLIFLIFLPKIVSCNSLKTFYWLAENKFII